MGPSDARWEDKCKYEIIGEKNHLLFNLLRCCNARSGFRFFFYVVISYIQSTIPEVFITMTAWSVKIESMKQFELKKKSA